MAPVVSNSAERIAALVNMEQARYEKIPLGNIGPESWYQEGYLGIPPWICEKSMLHDRKSARCLLSMGSGQAFEIRLLWLLSAWSTFVL